MEVREVLRQTSLFAGLSDAQLAELERAAHPVTYSPGELIVEAGTTDALGMWVVNDGEVEVSTEGYAVTRFGPGEYFGELALVAPLGTARSADVRAISQVAAIHLAREAFRRLIAASPALAMAVVGELAARLQRTNDLVGRLVALVPAHQAGKVDDLLTGAEAAAVPLLGPIEFALIREGT